MRVQPIGEISNSQQGTTRQVILKHCRRKFKQQDSFGEHFFASLDDEKFMMQTYLGSIGSIVIMMLTFLYAYQKADVIIKKKDVDILSTTRDLYWSPDKQFSNKNDNFNIAIAFTGFNNKVEYELDPSYGKLLINSFSWGYHEDGTFFTERRLVDSH